MSAALNNVTTEDAYKAATTLSCPGSVAVSLQVTNAAIFAQFGRSAAPGLSPGFDEREEFYQPVLAALDRRCDAVRVRSAVAGEPAQVTITARTEPETS